MPLTDCDGRTISLRKCGLWRDAKFIVALGDVRIDRQHPPDHPVGTGRQGAKHDLDYLAVGRVEHLVAIVDLLTFLVDNTDRAEGNLELFAQGQPDLRRRSFDRAADDRARPLKASM